MAKPHKLAWNGIDVETALTVEQLGNLAQRAALESTGDAEHGRHRIVSSPVTDRQVEFRVTDFEVAFKKQLVFYLDFDVRGGRTWLTSRIDWYLTTRSLFGGRTMVGHHTYLQFVHNLAQGVRSADPQARIVLREGVAGRAAPEPEPAPAPESPWGRGPAVPASAVAPEPDRPRAPVVESFAPPARPAAVASVAPPVVESFAPPSQPAVVASAPPGAPPQLVTAVPGMPSVPTAAPEPEPEPAGRLSSLAEQLFAEDEELYATRIAQSGGQALPWFFTLPDGTTVRFIADVVVGRNPVAPADSPEAVPVPLADHARSVSKTHALLELRDSMVWVTDLHSTNGTTLTNTVGEALECEPGTPMPVGDGWRIGFGDFEIAADRHA